MSWRQWLSWRSRPLADDARWVVLDVESSGLDAGRDRLLAIAAVGVHIDNGHAHIALADSFELVLRQLSDDTPPDKPNIVLHGIGVAAQRAGVDGSDAIDAFVRFVGQSPLLGFHVAFDRRLIERACTALGRAPLGNRWLDLEPLVAVLHPDVKARALDEWLTHFGIDCLKRHNAAADALATAELLLHLWPRLAAERATRVDAAITLTARRRWLA